jgi:F0F1-type ATP synthase beta subunit
LQGSFLKANTESLTLSFVDDLPESAFYMVGDIDEVKEKAEELKAHEQNL